MSWHDQILMAIPSVNGSHLLDRMLPTLDLSRSSILVLDQGSTDDTAAVCTRNNVELCQLGQPRTYTQACNAGLAVARERGVKYLCISNNDIIFKTKVARELFEEMEDDSRLGIVAASQVVVDQTYPEEVVSYRVYWSLHDVAFQHDTQVGDLTARRLESDFCELTCALIRISAIDEVGFLDDEFGFYHEDADFGFRLRKAGYSCAYLPRSQIKHFLSSTITGDNGIAKASYIAKNRVHFAQKHLGYSVRHSNRQTAVSNLWNSFNRDMHAYLRRYGLLEEEAPELMVAPFGTDVSGYIFVPNQRIEIAEWSSSVRRRYRAVFTSSECAREALRTQGVAHTFYVPPGVEPDIFHPWGPTHRTGDMKTYFMMIDGHRSRLLETVLRAWDRFLFAKSDVRLILCGYHLEGCVGRNPDLSYRLGDAEVARFDAECIDIHHLRSPVDARDLAQRYRDADYAVVGAVGEDDQLSAIQSLACGTPCIPIVHQAAAAGWLQDGASICQGLVGVDERGNRTAAVAPVDAAVAALEISYGLSHSARKALARVGFYNGRSRFTLRHTVMAINSALTELQIRNPSRVVAKLSRRKFMDPDQTLRGTAGTAHPNGSLAARQLMSAGLLASHVGAIWQDEGLVAASKVAGARLSSLLSRKVKRSSPKRGATASATRKWVAGRTVVVPGSTLLIGYVEAQLGLGESLRGLASAMSISDAPFKIYPYSVGVEGRRLPAYMAERYDLANAHAVNVIEVAPGELPLVFDNLGKEHFESSYNVLRTYWELSRAPEAWRPCLDGIHELWVPGPFVAESFRSVFDGPITIVPPSVNVAKPDLDGMAYFGMDPGAFSFLFSFDYFSFPERKNPLAVVRAFRRAFPDASARVALIIKSAGSIDHFPDLKRALRAASQDDSRIQIIDATLTRQEMLALLAASNCYVSLHRSEGFGLGMAEAMMLGKPVIGTGYSGNTDFLNERTGYPVPYVLQPVRPGDYLFPEDQVWAEPDEAAAAAALAQVFIHRDEAQARADTGRRLAEERYGPANVSHIVERRLADIFEYLRRERRR